MKKYILFSLVLLNVSSYAQQIRGKVIDGETSEPLAFANILFLDEASSSSPAGTVTDMDGNFAFNTHKESQAVSIGFLGYHSKDTIVTRNAFHTIKLTPDSNMLDEVVVKALRKTIKMENGGISMDVANSPLTNIGTANDVLEKLPFVIKNGEDITVLGKGTPAIYINNRLVRSASELERLSSSTIKKVTVITNPGSEYDATVSSVIRIEAIRPPGEGWGGEVFGRVDARKKISNDASIDLNYRINNLDLFGLYYYNDYRREVENALHRVLKTDQQTTTVYGDGIEKHHIRNNYFSGGFNYMFNNRHSAGAKYTYTNTPFYRVGMNLTTDVSIDHVPTEEFTTATLFDGDKKNSHLISVYYTGEMRSWLKTQLDFDYSKGDDNNRQNSLSERETNVYETVSSHSLQNYNLYAGKLTLTTPLWGSEFKYGAEFGRTTNEQKYIVNENEGADDLVSNTNLSKQNLFAAFVNYAKTISKWTFSLGARFENVNFDYFKDATRIKEQSRAYSDLFPSVSINYQGEKLQMMWGYRSTIDRPGYHQLRNSMQFDDPYTYETGNPFLKPTKTDDISYTLLWNKIKLMASYKMHTNLSLFVPLQYNDANIIVFRPENLKKAQNASVAAYYSPHFGIWEPVAGISVSKDFLRYGQTVKEKYETPRLHYSLQNTFRLPAGFVFMADLRGSTRGHEELFYVYNQFRIDARLTKTFMNGNLILNLRGTDITGNYKQKWRVNVHPVFTSINKDMDIRSFALSVRYKFNTTRSKYKGESVSEAERSRM